MKSLPLHYKILLLANVLTFTAVLTAVGKHEEITTITIAAIVYNLGANLFFFILSLFEE